MYIVTPHLGKKHNMKRLTRTEVFQQQYVYWEFKFRSRQGQNNKQNVLGFKLTLPNQK